MIILVDKQEPITRTTVTGRFVRGVMYGEPEYVRPAVFDIFPRTYFPFLTRTLDWKEVYRQAEETMTAYDIEDRLRRGASDLERAMSKALNFGATYGRRNKIILDSLSKAPMTPIPKKSLIWDERHPLPTTNKK
jgi:hypothetical protein